MYLKCTPQEVLYRRMPWGFSIHHLYATAGQLHDPSTPALLSLPHHTLSQFPSSPAHSSLRETVRMHREYEVPCPQCTQLQCQVSPSALCTHLQRQASPVLEKSPLPLSLPNPT